MYSVYLILFSRGFKFSKIVYALKFLVIFIKYGNITTENFTGSFFENTSHIYRFFNKYVIYPDQIIPISAGGFWFFI